MKKIANNRYSFLAFITVFGMILLLSKASFPQSNSFVYLKDGKFYQGCEEFNLMAINYPVTSIKGHDGNYYISPDISQCDKGPCGFSCGNEISMWKDEIILHLNKIKALKFNTIRLVGFTAVRYEDWETESPILKTPGYYVQNSDNLWCLTKQGGMQLNPIIMDRQCNLLQQFVDIINENGLDLKIIPLLGGHGVEMLPDVYSGYISYIANRFKDEPVILGYDFYNEPVWWQYPNNLTKTEIYTMWLTWYNAAKQNAPSHLITVGSKIYDVFKWDPEILPVDFISFHPYAVRKESETWQYQPPVDRYKVFIKYESEQFSKPVILGETGYSAIDPAHVQDGCDSDSLHPIIGDLADQVNFADYSLKYSGWYGFQGYSWWIYKDYPWYACDKVEAMQNYYGLVYLAEHCNNSEDHKPAGEVFINPDTLECNDCFDPPASFYHNPTFTGQDTVLYSNFVTSTDGPVEDAFIWASLYDTSWNTLDQSFAITDSVGYFKLYTSIDNFDDKFLLIQCSKPGYEVHQQTFYKIPPQYNPVFSIIPFDPPQPVPEYNTWLIEDGEDVTWEASKVPGPNDVVIEPGGVLTVKAPVYFNETSKLIVERGGKLIVDEGGRLTSNCSSPWKGVEVRGQYNRPQEDDYQGIVEITNGGIIENAVCGISTIKFGLPEGDESIPQNEYSGGMVLCDGAIFKNNNIAVKFWPYTYAPSNSLFRNCQFITNNDLLPGADPGYFIKMNNIAGIDIGGCAFTDEHNSTFANELTSGIESYSANYSLFTTGGQPNVFTGLYDGIRAYTSNPARTVSIKDCLFSENLRSVYLVTQMEAIVTGNTFHPWNDDVPFGEQSYCLYLDYCNDYTVEENVFVHTGHDPTGIGLVINNSGPDNNEIYRNNFTNLSYATLAQNCNRGEYYDDGLVIKCNDYWDNFQDIAVTADEEVEYPGIARNQGAEGSTEMQAGNLFSLDDNGNAVSDYSTFKQGPITYFHHDPAIEPRVKPEYYTDKYISLDDQGTYYSEEGSCPSHLSGGGGGSGGDDRDGMRTEMLNNESKADSTQALLSALVDGGSTEVLQQEVLQTMPPEAYDLYLSLMGKSPYLSDSVLIATIEKENILPNVIIKDILVANPQSAKSPEIMDKVDDKLIPMTEEMIAEILLGKYIVAAKEKLESQLAYYQHNRSTALKFLKQSFLNDTIDPHAQDSLIALLENETGLLEKYQLAFAYLNKNHIASAENLLNAIPATYSLNTYKLGDYNDFVQMFGVVSEIHTSGIPVDSISAEMKQSLLQLADNSNNVTGAIARNILIQADGYEYTEPIILPEMGLKSSIVIDIPATKDFKPEYINIYPNPAMNYIIVELNKTNLSGTTLTLFDNSGKIVKAVQIPAQTQDYVLGLKDVKPGIYILKADMDSKTIGSKKFSIIN